MEKEFNIRVKMEERWVDHFCSMLKKMEALGGIGSSKVVAIYSDGDGDFRPKFGISVNYDVAEYEVNERGVLVYDAG